MSKHNGISLGEWILSMIERGLHTSDEFKAVLNYYGRPRFEEAYKKALKEKKAKLERKR